MPMRFAVLVVLLLGALTGVESTKISRAYASNCTVYKGGASICKLNIDNFVLEGEHVISLTVVDGGRIITCTRGERGESLDNWNGDCDGDASDANFITVIDHEGHKKLFGSLTVGSLVCHISTALKGESAIRCQAPIKIMTGVIPNGTATAAGSDRKLRFGFKPSSANVDDRRLQDDGSVIDIMVVWTKAAECGTSFLSYPCTFTAQTELAMLGSINLAIAYTNTAFAESGVATKLRLVHAYRHPDYVEGTGVWNVVNERALTNMADVGVDTKRALYGADLVAFIIGTPAGSFCSGVANVPAWNSLTPSWGYLSETFSVTGHRCLIHGGANLFAHEVAHNMGALHDRGTERTCNDQSGKYNYGFRDPAGQYATIMAYRDTREKDGTKQCDNIATKSIGVTIPRFSNPNILYQGKATGSARHNNARWLNEKRAAVASVLPAMNCRSNEECEDGDETTVDTCNLANAACVFTPRPARVPTKAPVRPPTTAPVTRTPTLAPIKPPSKAPITRAPIKLPTRAPAMAPTKAPLRPPTQAPVKSPTKAPLRPPTNAPVISPTKAPVKPPTKSPIKPPTRAPVRAPTKAPLREPTKAPLNLPTKTPMKQPTKKPTNFPTSSPTISTCGARMDTPFALVTGETCSFSANPIVAISKTMTDVTISIQQTWTENSPLGLIATKYTDHDGVLFCDPRTHVGASTELAYTSKCSIDGYAQFDVFVHDVSFSNSLDNAVLPAECETFFGEEGYDGVNELCHFSMKIACSCDTTASPTDAPTPPTDCESRVDSPLTRVAGQTCAYTSQPVIVVSKSTTAVTIIVHQTWTENSNLGLIATQYIDTDGPICEADEDIYPASELSYTALCVDGVAQFDVFVQDRNTFSPQLDNAILPEDCGPALNDDWNWSMGFTGHGICHYQIKIACACDTPSPTIEPTKAPVKAPTKAPARPPSKAPVKPPTKAPMKPPTKAPVKPPTKAPTKPPTKAPVKPPSKAPVKPPTKSPVKPPTKAPVKPPTKAPVRPPTKAPIKPPTMAPVKPPTKAPARPPTKAPVKPPTKAPVKPPTQAPVRPPTKAPVKPPTKAPVKPPTKAPVRPPTKAPIKPPTMAPVKPPTKAPVKPPTKAPVKPPTKAPVKPPTNAPVKPPTSAPVKPRTVSSFHAENSIPDKLSQADTVRAITAKNAGHDPDGIWWIKRESWTPWDGKTTYNPCTLNTAQLQAGIFPGNIHTMRGLREVFYQIKPFANNTHPTVAEIERWNIEVIRHFRRLLGFNESTHPVENDKCTFLRSGWAEERARTNHWSAKYPGPLNSAAGPCKVPYSPNAHCGAAFLPDNSDQAPYLAGTGTSSCIATEAREGILTTKTVPWAVLMSRVIGQFLWSDGIGAHTGPYVGRSKFGSAWYLPGGETLVLRGKWSGDLAPTCP